MKSQLSSTVKIFESSDYSAINHFKSNRLSSTTNLAMFSTTALNIFKRRVKILKELIGENGFDERQAIILWKNPKTKQYFLVDGLGRLTACKELNVPFYYTLLEGFKTEAEVERYMFKINNERKNWTIEDKIMYFINSSSTNKETKQKLDAMLKMRKQHSLPLTSSMVLFFNMQGSWKPEVIEKTVQREKSVYCDEAISLIEECSKRIPYAKSEKFIIAINNLVKHPGYSVDVRYRLIKGIVMVQNNQSSHKAWTAVFHNIINAGISKPKQLIIDLVGEKVYKGNRP